MKLFIPKKDVNNVGPIVIYFLRNANRKLASPCTYVFSKRSITPNQIMSSTKLRAEASSMQYTIFLAC